MKVIEMLLRFCLQMALELTKMGFQILGVLLTWCAKAIAALFAALTQRRPPHHRARRSKRPAHHPKHGRPKWRKRKARRRA